MLNDVGLPQGLFVQREFLDENLRTAILAESMHSDNAAGAIYRGTSTMVDEDYRRCRVVGVPPRIEAEIASRLDDLKPKLEAHFQIALEGYQQPRLLQYRKGDFFVAHQDSDERGPSWLRDRKVTAVMFVNGPQDNQPNGGYRGGTLTLYRLSEESSGDDVRTRVPGERGLLVAFRASLFHEVSRITRGERYSIVTWFF